ncbi:MAG: type II toxin-antitoxin system RelE/ParE family toxin [Candidatus Aenigmarchaeota archaeon]|nr:type II toxin-antitoxin system RelE/ParE family toxin [Candidatus Aenigmarchaeota archaeon]
MYDIIFSKKAKNQLKKLEKNIQKRIIAVLERIRIRPEAHVKKLVGESAYKLRVGNYRILMDIDNGTLLIMVIKIGHRKNVYKEY